MRIIHLPSTHCQTHQGNFEVIFRYRRRYIQMKRWKGEGVGQEKKWVDKCICNCPMIHHLRTANLVCPHFLSLIRLDVSARSPVPTGEQICII